MYKPVDAETILASLCKVPQHKVDALEINQLNLTKNLPAILLKPKNKVCFDNIWQNTRNSYSPNRDHDNHVYGIVKWKYI